MADKLYCKNYEVLKKSTLLSIHVEEIYIYKLIIYILLRAMEENDNEEQSKIQQYWWKYQQKIQ